MTEKSIKNLKNKKQHLKLKKPANVPQKKVFDSDSDISEPDDGKPRPKMDHRALNKISSEVTDLLATLKKEHGMDNDDNDDDDGPAETVKSSPSKKDKKKLLDQVKTEANNDNTNNKNKQQQKKRAANAGNPLVSEIKKLKVDNTAGKKTAKQQQQQQQQAKAKKVNANQKQKRPADATAAATGLATAIKDEGDSDDDDMAAAPPQAKKIKTNPNANPNKKQKQKQNPNAVVKAEKKPTVNDETAEEENPQDDKANVKKEHHLKNSVPVYVGNLPNNIKRLKLLKLFKQYGKVLSIRFRSNSGKSLFKTALIKKAPFVIAFIYFETREAAEASLELNGTQVGDNVIVVDIDANKREKFQQALPNTVVVGNLKYAVTEQVLRKSFKCCGEIEHIRTIQGPEGCKGVAFIRFTKPESCELALKLNGTEILNREVRVERYSAKKKKDKAQAKGKKGQQQQHQKSGKFKKNAAKGGERGQLKKPKVEADDDGNVHKKMGKKNKNKAKTVKEFMGTKSVDNKKVANQKKKKKNKLSAEKRLAKKVAPKSIKTESA